MLRGASSPPWAMSRKKPQEFTATMRHSFGPQYVVSGRKVIRTSGAHRRLGFVDYNGSGLEVDSSLLNVVSQG